MSGHRGFIFMLAMVPVAISGLLYVAVTDIQHTLYQRKVQHFLSVNDPCNPKKDVGAIYDFPQQAPQDAPPPTNDPKIDGPCSVFHPLEDFDDLVQRFLPSPPNDPNPI